MDQSQQIDKSIAKIQFPKKFEGLFRPKNARYRVFYGGRGGAKSWCFARALLSKGLKSPLRILCAREFQTSIKDSVHKLLSDQIYDLELQGFYEITQTTIRGLNGTEFIFVGIKNNTNNVKSIEGIDICWVEEAQSVSSNSWNVLIPTIRKANSEIWISFNPELPSDETWKRFVESPPEGAVVQKVNWSDNPWFPDVLDYERRALHSRDIAAYNNIWEGIPRTQVDGAVFGKEMEFAELDGRITRVPYDPIKPVFTIWDLGFADSTSIWFVQFIGMEIRVIRYIEDNQKTISWYLAEIQKFGYMFDTHYLPHDAGSHSLGTGKSIEEIVRATGVKVQVLDRVPIVDSINAARTIFPRCYFDRQNTEEGLNCLRHYRYDVDEHGQFSQKPIHDQYSHGADAWRMLGLMVNEPKKKQVRKPSYMPQGSWMG
jgi:phage terminase large subunit